MANKLTKPIIATIVEGHRSLSPGLLESIYEEALTQELLFQNLKIERQVEIDGVYKGKVIKKQRIDLFVEGQVIIEIKAVSQLPEVARAQTFLYLKPTDLKRVLLIHSGQKRLVGCIKRISP